MQKFHVIQATRKDIACKNIDLFLPLPHF